MMRNLAAVELGSRRDCACTVHGRVGRGRQPPPDEGLQSQQPSQRGSKHHFLDDDAASDHGISGGVAAQLRQAGERLAVVIAAGAATATTAAMSAAAMTAAARACYLFGSKSSIFPSERLKIQKILRLRRKKTPARCARRWGVGQLEYPPLDSHPCRSGGLVPDPCGS